MKHYEALTDYNYKPLNPKGCDGELKHATSDFQLDVYWIIYRCEKCGKYVWTVQGQRHWWNFESDKI